MRMEQKEKKEYIWYFSIACMLWFSSRSGVCPCSSSTADAYMHFLTLLVSLFYKLQGILTPCWWKAFLVAPCISSLMEYW